MSFKQFITQQVELDIGHRVMHERIQCFSMHGHRVKIELRFAFTLQQELGYYIDFKEIKRIGGQWLHDVLDHGFIANPKDHAVIQACQQTGSKLYLMSLNGIDQYCNPTAENVAREIFMAMEILFLDYPHLEVEQVRYYETPNCWVEAQHDSIIDDERTNFYAYRLEDIKHYAKIKGKVEYDIRKISAEEH